LIEFGYYNDSLGISKIPVKGNEKVFEFLEERLKSIPSDINMEIVGPYKFKFQIRSGGNILLKPFPESVNQPSGLRGSAYSWVNEINLVIENSIDFKKWIYMEFGPTARFYENVNSNSKEIGFINDISQSFENDNRIYSTYDEANSPMYPGGIEELDKFLYNNIIEPIKKEEHTNRTLIYMITIEKNGSISDIMSTRNRGTKESELGLKALRSKMKNWIPANIQGNNVRSKYALVVRIKPFYSDELIRKMKN